MERSWGCGREWSGKVGAWEGVEWKREGVGESQEERSQGVFVNKCQGRKGEIMMLERA